MLLRNKRIILILLLVLILRGFTLLIEAKSNEETYQEKLAKLKPDDTKGYYELGLWCQQSKLDTHAQEMFEKVIELEPNHSGARQKLDYIKYKNKWIKKGVESKVDYEEQLAKLKEDDVKGHYELGIWCKQKGLSNEAKTEFNKVITLDPNHPQARNELDYYLYDGKWIGINDVFTKYFNLKELSERKEFYDKFVKENEQIKVNKKYDFTYFEKLYHYKQSPTGVLEEIKLQNKPPKSKFPYEPTYTLAVPTDYNPLKKYPLLVALHGGGPQIVQGKQFLGMFYPEATNKGYILVYPTHPRQPINGTGSQNLWHDGDTPQFVFSVIDEIKSNYPIDEKLIFLTGSSFGGGGAWGIACANPGKFAGLGVLCGYTYSLALTDCGFNFKNLKGIPIYFIHGDKDRNIPVEDARMTAKKCQALNLDYKYVELKGVAHEIPENERLKILDWFEEKVLRKRNQ